MRCFGGVSLAIIICLQCLSVSRSSNLMKLAKNYSRTAQTTYWCKFTMVHYCIACSPHLRFLLFSDSWKQSLFVCGTVAQFHCKNGQNGPCNPDPDPDVCPLLRTFAHHKACTSCRTLQAHFLVEHEFCLSSCACQSASQCVCLCVRARAYVCVAQKQKFILPSFSSLN